MFRTLCVFALVACTGGGTDPDDDGKDDPTGLSDGPKREAVETDVALDEATSLGFAPQALVDHAAGEHASTMTWADEGNGPVALTATLDGRVVFQVVYPTGSGPDMGVSCNDHVTIEGHLQVSTEDGRLDEIVDVAFLSTDGLEVEAHADLDIDGLDGTLVFDDFHSETHYDACSLWVTARFDAQGTSGEVGGSTEGSGDCEHGEACTAGLASWRSAPGATRCSSRPGVPLRTVAAEEDPWRTSRT